MPKRGKNSESTTKVLMELCKLSPPVIAAIKVVWHLS
jgi:hypothetical protein